MRTVPAGAALLAYEESGSGVPLVLIHAGVADRRMWEPQVAALATRFRVIRYDLRGYGDSTLPDEAYENHEDLRALLDGLGIRRAAILGLSMGGTIALDFALSQPDRVGALIVCGATPSGTPATDDIRAGWSAVDALLEDGKVSEAIELELQMWVDGPFRRPDQVDPLVRDHVREMEEHAFRRALSEPEAQTLPLDPPAAGRVHEILAPTLVLVGDLDYPQKVEVAREMATSMPNARIEMLAGTAHMPNMEQPVAFNELVMDFLATCGDIGGA